jgi:hypothetical protein
VGGVQLLQHLGDDRGAGDHEHRGEEEALRGGPAEGRAEELGGVQHQHRADGGGHRDGQSQALEPSEAEAHADGEDEEDEAELREHFDPGLVFDELERRRVRADDDARRQVADHDGEPDFPADPAGRARHHHHHREIPDET